MKAPLIARRRRAGCLSPAWSPSTLAPTSPGSSRVEDLFFIDVEGVADYEDSTCYPSEESDFPGPGPAPLHCRESWHLGRMLAPLCLSAIFGALIGITLARLVDLNGARPQLYEIVPPPDGVSPSYMASPGLNNSCLIPNLEMPDGPQTFNACQFVIESTDEIWNKRGDVNAAIDKYFHEGYFNAGSWGRRGVGIPALKEAVYSEMRAFPDIRIHITDCSCRGNDLDGYKCMMPDVLEGTNTGPSAWGPATNRYARWNGLVESYVRRDARTGQWQYVAEWGVHDEWALLQQLGLDFARVPHPSRNDEPIHDCEPLLRVGSTPALSRIDAATQASHL